MLRVDASTYTVTSVDNARRRSVADSGNVMHRRFWSACGTPLFSEAEARPHLVFVRAGTLDDPELGRPSATIWTAAAPSWACIDPSLPRVERQPPPPRLRMEWSGSPAANSPWEPTIRLTWTKLG